MESGSEFDSLSELPPLPQELRFSSSPLVSLPPLPPSDFAPFFSDNKPFLPQPQQLGDDSFFLDSASPLPLFTRHHLNEPTQLLDLFHNDSFLHMPNLKSMETTNPFPCLSLSLPSHNTRRHSLGPKKLGSVVRNTFTVSSSASSSSNSGSPAKSSQSAYERQRGISDKIRSLEKLMPCEKKMDMATVLEEAHKYITFLHSQIAALRWMPLESVYSTAGKPGEADLLRSLTRQQILQVIANSPGARTVLYSRGVCVFSSEQLLTLKMMPQSANNTRKF